MFRMSLVEYSTISSMTFCSRAGTINSIHMDLNSRNDSQNKNADLKKMELHHSYSEVNNLKTVRNKWTSHMYFLLSSISYAVELTTVFRFPYLCYIHGGGAFLIAYLITLTFCIVPLLYLELLIGQYFHQGCVSLWKIALLFKGIGWASCILTFLASFYYNTFIAWAFYYLFSTFQSELPWSSCNHSWNTKYCQEQTTDNISLVNATVSTAAREFFEIKMLGVDKSNGFGDFGSIQLGVCCCLFLINLLLFLSLFKGVKVLEKLFFHGEDHCIVYKEVNPETRFYYGRDIHTSKGNNYFRLHTGIAKQLATIIITLKTLTFAKNYSRHIHFKSCTIKCYYMACNLFLFNKIWHSELFLPFFCRKVSWITFTVPYLGIFLILIRGITLSNAGYGIKMFLTPSFTKLLEWKIWFDASSQAFFSLGVGFGVHVAYGSYNRVNQPVYIDCIITTAMNAITSLLNTISLYSFMDLGLVFIVYTSAFNTLSVPHLWCILLFAMLVTLGLGSSIGATESFLAAFCDECTIFNLNTKKYFRLGLVTAFLLSSFIISIPTICQGGYYLVHYLDHYACSTSLLLVSLFQCFAIVYVYGIHSLSSNIEEITNKQMYFTTRFILKFFVPLILIFMLVCKIVTSTNLHTTVGGRSYHYSDLSVTVSQLFGLIALLPILINMSVQIYNIAKRENSWYLRLAMLITPPKERDEIRQTGHCKRLKIAHWFKI
ncbi:Sodium-dependent dopamine transporter [Schistosoma japonicum]|nr:Sodium-dependent dopamine transporter [Schistosoma japonicum]